MSDYRSLYQPNTAGQFAGAPPGAAMQSPYEILIRQSRLLGRVAARACTMALHKKPSKFKSARAERKYFEKNPDRLHDVVEQSRDTLVSARTVPLPSNLFPDSVAVDRMRVTVTRRSFFWNEDVVSLRIEDILNVSAGVGPFFGSLRLSTRVMNSIDHFTIDGFWRKDALMLKRIIEGAIIAVNEGVDTADLSRDRLVRKLNQLGGEPDEL